MSVRLLKLSRNGNSTGITIPEPMLYETKWKRGDWLAAEWKGLTLVLRRVDAKELAAVPTRSGEPAYFRQVKPGRR